jgi:hypothetical protein
MKCEAAGELHNEELHELHSSPSIIRMIKLMTITWTGHVARMENRNPYRELVGKPKEKKTPLGRPKIDGSVIVKLVLEEKKGGG